MKKRIPSFLAGMLTMALIGSLAIPALASAGMTITVDPINIQVNGQTFQPKDVNGNDVPVFAQSGTTYAPLRALAEAYGLEVGYDSKTNMATVSEPGTAPTTPAAPSTNYSDWSAEEEAAYQEFKGMWAVEFRERGKDFQGKDYEAFNLIYNKTLTLDEKNKLFHEMENFETRGFLERLAYESSSSKLRISLWFYLERVSPEQSLYFFKLNKDL